MKERIKLLEFIVNSMKMFDKVEKILVYNKEHDRCYMINELYHIDNNGVEFMIIEI